MIPKSGNRFSEKIMLKQKINDESDSTQLKQTLGYFAKGPKELPTALARHKKRTRPDYFGAGF
jgi:hypothetical protein